MKETKMKNLTHISHEREKEYDFRDRIQSVIGNGEGFSPGQGSRSGTCSGVALSAAGYEFTYHLIDHGSKSLIAKYDKANIIVYDANGDGYGCGRGKGSGEKDGMKIPFKLNISCTDFMK